MKEFIYRPAYAVVPGTLSANVYTRWEDVMAAVNEAAESENVTIGLDDDWHITIPPGFHDMQHKARFVALSFLPDLFDLDSPLRSTFARAQHARLEKLARDLPLTLLRTK